MLRINKLIPKKYNSFFKLPSLSELDLWDFFDLNDCGYKCISGNHINQKNHSSDQW